MACESSEVMIVLFTYHVYFEMGSGYNRLMKYIPPFWYLLSGLASPLTLLAGGESGDGHVEHVAVPNPEARGGVIIALAIFAILFGVFMWYAKRQNAPKPLVTPVPPTPPSA